MNTQPKTKEEFFDTAGERKSDLRKIDEIITKAAPKLKRGISGGMLTYGPFHYKYPSGREGDTAVISLANQKNHMSLYICAVKEAQYLPEVYGEILGKVDIGKSCVRFKSADDIKAEELQNIVRDAENWLHQNYPHG